MEPKDQDRTKMNRVLLDFLIEAADGEIREALAESGEAFNSLAARGKSAVQRALSATPDEEGVVDLHRGLGALVQLLRRRDHLSVDELAQKARVDSTELRCIELDPSYDPNPRTIFQLERHFKLPERSLVVLSGAVRVEDGVREEAVRFAASSANISGLTKDERKLLVHFVRFLREHTD